jgi:hypothetical protein
MPSPLRSRASGSVAHGAEHKAVHWKDERLGKPGRPQASQLARKSSNKPDGSAETMTEIEEALHEYVTALKEVISSGETLRDFIRDNPEIRLAISPGVIESINLVANTVIAKAGLPDELEAERPKNGLDSIREALGFKPQPRLRRI